MKLEGKILNIEEGMFSIVSAELLGDRNAYIIKCDKVVNVRNKPKMKFKGHLFFEVSIGAIMRAEEIETLEFYSTILNSTYCIWKTFCSKRDRDGAVCLEPIEYLNRDSFIKVFGSNVFDDILKDIEKSLDKQ